MDNVSVYTIKGTWAPFNKYVKFIKLCFKIKEILDFSVEISLYVLATFMEKKSDFPRLYSPFAENCLDKVLNSFLVKRKMEQNSTLSKQEPCHRSVSHYWRKFRMALESYFRFHGIVNVLTSTISWGGEQIKFEIYFPFFSGMTQTIFKIFSR